MALQIPLELPLTPSFARIDFLPTASNEAAFAAIQNPTHLVQILLGPKGSGKTHLAAIWQHMHNAQIFNLSHYDPAHTLPVAFIWENADQQNWNTPAQKQSFHLLNSVRENKTRLLITATQPVHSWGLTLPDLSSRLLALPVAQLAAPDDDLVSAMLIKHFSDRQVQIAGDVLAYLVPRMPRDGGEILEIINRLDHAALATKRAITIPLIKNVMAENIND